MASVRNSSGQIEKYQNYINYHRGYVLSPDQLSSIAEFNFDEVEFNQLLTGSKSLKDCFYNKSIAVNLHADGLVGHVSGNLPVLQKDNTIKIEDYIGLDPKPGESLIKTIIGVKGGIFSQERSIEPHQLHTVRIPVTQEVFNELATKLAAYKESPPLYQVHGKHDNNCIHFMNKLLIDAGIVDGLKNKFSYEDFCKLDYRLIKFQAVDFVSDIDRIKGEEHAAIFFDLEEFELENAYNKEIAAKCELRKQKSQLQQKQNDIKKFLSTPCKPSKTVLLDEDRDPPIVDNVNTPQNISSPIYQLPSYLEASSNQQLTWSLNSQENSASTSFTLETTLINQLLDEGIIDEMPEIKDTIQLDVDDDHEFLNYSNGDWSASYARRDTSKKKANHRPIPTLSDNMKIVDINIGPAIGGGTGVLLALASGAVVSVGTGASGSGITVGISVALGEGMGAALISGGLVALPVAIVVVAINLFQANKAKKIQRKLKHNLRNTEKDINHINTDIRASLNSLIDDFDNKKIGLDQLRNDIHVINADLQKINANLVKRNHYDYKHKQIDRVYFYLLNHAHVKQIIVDNKNFIRNQELFNSVAEQVKLQSNNPLHVKISRIKVLANNPILTKAEYYEFILLTNEIAEGYSHSATLHDLANLQELRDMRMGSAIEMATISCPKSPEIKCFKRGKNKSDKHRTNLKIKTDHIIKEIDGAYRAFKEKVESNTSVNIDDARNQFLSLLRHKENELSKIGLIGESFNNCRDFLKEYTNTLKQNVDRAYHARKAALQNENRQVVFNDSNIRSMSLHVALDLFYKNANKLFDESISDSEKQAAFQAWFDAANIVKKQNIQDSDFTDNAVTKQNLDQQIDAAIKVYNDACGSYVLSKKIQSLNPLLDNGDLSQARAIAIEIMEQKPSQEIHGVCESLVKKIDFLKNNQIYNDNLKLLEENSVSTEDKIKAFENAAEAAHMLISIDIQAAESLNESDVSYHQIKENAQVFIKLYEDVGGIFSVLQNIRDIQAMLEDKDAFSNDTVVSNIYIKAKDIIKFSENEKISKEIIKYCDDLICGSYNASYHDVRAPLANAAVAIYANHAARFGGLRTQKIATVLSCAHAIFPTLLPDCLFLPYATLMSDVKYWSANFKQNIKANLNELTSWNGAITLSLQADGILNAFTNVHKKYPITQYISPSLSGLCKTTTVINAYNAWNDSANLSSYYSFIIDSSVGAAFGLYELCTSRVTLPDDVSQQSWTDKLQFKIQQKLSLPVGDVSDNKHYYEAKDFTKLTALFLIPTNPISIGARAFQGMMMAYNFYSSGYVEQTLIAMITNAAYYAKQKNYSKASEILKKMESTIKNVYGSLNYKASNSKIVKQACIYLFDSESAGMFENGHYAELRKYSEYRLEKGILIFNNTLFPVDLNLNLIFLRLTAHACDKKFFLENTEKIYQELNELYAFVMESRTYVDDEKLKLRENFNAIADCYYNAHVTYISKSLQKEYISFLNGRESHSELKDCEKLVESLEESGLIFIDDYTKKLSAESIHFLGVAYYLMGHRLSLDYIKFFDKIRPEENHYEYWFTLAKTIEKFVESISDDEKKLHLNKMIQHCYNQVDSLIAKSVKNVTSDSVQKSITQWRDRHAHLEPGDDLIYDSEWMRYLENIAMTSACVTSKGEVSATEEEHVSSENLSENKFDNKVTNKSFTLFNKEKIKVNAKNKYIDELRYAIKTDGDPDLKEEDRIKRAKRAIRRLNKDDLDQMPDSGTSLILLACLYFREEIVDLLLKAKANPDVQELGYTPLTIAVEQGRQFMCALLLRAKADPNLAEIESTGKESRTPLTIASSKDDCAVVEALLDAKADPNKIDETSGNSPLLCAFSQGKGTAVVEALLDAGADPNKINEKRGNSPIMLAVSQGDVDIVQVLLNAKPPNKANPDLYNEVTDKKPLTIATEQGNEEMVRLLLRANADPDVSEFDSGKLARTPLTIATSNGHAGITQALLDAHADPNKINDKTGNSPIMLAVAQGDVNIVQALLNAKANPNLYNEMTEETTLTLATQQGNEDMIRLLVSANADPDASEYERNGNRPILLAAKR